jgi:hypothetical protein
MAAYAQTIAVTPQSNMHGISCIESQSSILRNPAGQGSAMTDASPLLNVAEAAAYLRCSESHLNKLRVTGGGPQFAKIGTSVRYRCIDLDRYVEKHLHKSTAA